MAQQRGTVRAEIANNGQYECKASDLDSLIEDYWPMSRLRLVRKIEEMTGMVYDSDGMARIELIMVIAELSGYATN